MKKLNLYLWLIALVGLFAACSQDESDALQTANGSNCVTFTASLPADFAQPGTRANEVPAFPANRKLRCILEVWDEELTTLKVRKEVCPAAGAAKIDFTFELDNGAYNALLWADYIPEITGTSSATIAGLSGVEHYTDMYYKTDNAAGLKEVQLLMVSADCKVRDAFCAAKPFTKEATALKNLTATLTRPLTKLTIAEKNTTNFGYCQKVTPIYSVPKTLDVSTGTVSALTQMTISYHSANSVFGDDITVNGTPCKVLFSNYIFAEADGTMPEINLTFTATAESGKVLPDVTIPAGIPVKRNHRINAAGTLITAQDAPSKTVNMSVDINSGWAEPDENKDIALSEVNVGDYYYSDGTWSTDLDNSKTLLGVVFKVGPGTRESAATYGDKLATDQIRGYVVAAKRDNNAPYCLSEESFGLSTSTTDYTGYAGTQTIRGRSDYTYQDFAAFYNILNRTPVSDAGVKNSGWYMPSVAQLVDVYGERSILTPKLQIANGSDVGKIEYSGTYVTTTEESATHWKAVRWADDNSNCTIESIKKGEFDGIGGSYQDYRIRAVLTF